MEATLVRPSTQSARPGVHTGWNDKLAAPSWQDKYKTLVPFADVPFFRPVPRAPLKSSHKKEIYRRSMMGESHVKIAKACGLSPTTVGNACKRIKMDRK